MSLARALVLEPEVLFFDEPFSALDVPTRVAFMRDLAELLDEQRTTTVLVTHDRAEARALADRVAVLLEGRIAQLGPVEEVFEHPADPRVRAFLESEELPRRRPDRIAARGLSPR